MGVLLTPIIIKQDLALADLRGKRLAVDANGELYQFLALIRLRDGSPLMDSHGRITSHLSGLFYRTTRLINDHGTELVFALDGKPTVLRSYVSHYHRSRLQLSLDKDSPYPTSQKGNHDGLLEHGEKFCDPCDKFGGGERFLQESGVDAC